MFIVYYYLINLFNDLLLYYLDYMFPLLIFIISKFATGLSTVSISEHNKLQLITIIMKSKLSNYIRKHELNGILSKEFIKIYVYE